MGTRIQADAERGGGTLHRPDCRLGTGSHRQAAARSGEPLPLGELHRQVPAWRWSSGPGGRDDSCGRRPCDGRNEGKLMATKRRRSRVTPAFVLPVWRVEALKRKLRATRKIVRSKGHFITACAQAEAHLTAVLADLSTLTPRAAIFKLPKLD